MKIECKEEKIIVYLYRYTLDLDNMEKLNKEIKSIFIKLIKVYHLNFFGYNKVHVYHHQHYGNILEIENIYNTDYNNDIIDLKIIIHDKTLMFLEFDDYIDNQNVKFKNGKYYLNMDQIDNIYPYLEFGKIVYCQK